MGNIFQLRWLSLLLLLFPSVAFAIPTIVVLHLHDDIHPSGFDDYRTDTASHPEDSPAQWITPDLDTMADAGVRFNSLYAQNVCSPTRAEIFGFGAVGRVNNPFGRVTSGQIPAQHSIDLQLGTHTLIAAYKDLGYTVAGFGKLHLGRERVANFGIPTWAKLMGFDHYEAMVQSNDSLGVACAALRTNVTTCWGHNYWCQYNMDGSFSITGSGVSTDNAANGYVNKVIETKAAAYITSAISEGGKYFIIIGWHAPHSPWKDGDNDGGDADCDYDDDGVLDDFQDDRPPGGSCDDDGNDGNLPCYGAQLVDADDRMGNINALLNLASGNANHMAIALSDNGVPGSGAGTKCLASPGVKGTPYPCGTNIFFVAQGDDVSGTNREVNGLFQAVDIPHTLVELAGGSFSHRDGMSFAGCITGSSCTSNSVVISHEYAGESSSFGMGGNDSGDGTAGGTNRFPPQTGDTAAEWDYNEYGAVTKDCNSKTFFLHRKYDTDIVNAADEFCELLFELTVSVPYSTIGTVLQQTTCVTPNFAGAITPSGADEICAYAILNPAITGNYARSQVSTNF